MKTQTYTKIDTIMCRYQKLSNDCPNPKWRKFSNCVIMGKYVNPMFDYLLDNMFEAYSKIDGTCSKIVFYPSSGEIVVGGKTDNATSQCGQFEYLQAIADRIKPQLEIMYPKDSAKFVPAVDEFKRIIINEDNTVNLVESPIYIYGEYYGKGIQSCGGSYSKTNHFAVFDICQYGWWIPSDMRHDICMDLKLDEVPRHVDMSLRAAIAKVRKGFKTCVFGGDVVNPEMLEEGLVLRPTVPLKDSRGNRIIVKVKTCDFNKWNLVRNEFTDEEFIAFNKWYFSEIEPCSEDELNHVIKCGLKD